MRVVYPFVLPPVVCTADNKRQTQRSHHMPSPLAGEGGVPRSGAPGEGSRPWSVPGPHLIALRAICPLPQGERESDHVLAARYAPEFAARTKATAVSPPNKKGRRSAGRRKRNRPHHTNRCRHLPALRARRAPRTTRTVRFGRARLSALHRGSGRGF